MRVISVDELEFGPDREGNETAKVAIDIWVERKDDLGREYHVMTRDKKVFFDGSETEIRDRNGKIQTKEYIYTYEEYDAQKAALESMFPTELTGSDKDDYLLQSGLLVSLSQVPIYGIVGEIGEKYIRV